MPNCRMYGGFMETIGNLWLYIAFFGIVIVMLLIDFLGFKQKQGQDVSIKQAAYWSVAWVSVAALFGGGLWLYLQQTVGVTLANQKPWNTLRVTYSKNPSQLTMFSSG